MSPGWTDFDWLRGVDLNHRPLGYEPQKITSRLYPSLIYIHLRSRCSTLFWGVLFPTCSSFCSQNSCGFANRSGRYKSEILSGLPTNRNRHICCDKNHDGSIVRPSQFGSLFRLSGKSCLPVYPEPSPLLPSSVLPSIP